jgi:hypothetical protein
MYLGFENGDVMIRNTRTDEQRVIHIAGNHVYNIAEYDDDMLLVCARDEGLSVIRVSPGGEVALLNRCAIPGKGTHYGVYSIEREGDAVILGTSNGCYLLRSPDDTLLQPYREQLPPHAFNKILRVGERVYMATNSALLAWSDGAATPDTLLAGKAIEHLFYRDSLYISTPGAGVWRLDIIAPDALPRQLSPDPARAYLKDTLGNAWIVGHDHVTYRAAGYPPVIHQVPRGASIPDRQVALVDEEFFYLARGNYLFAFPIHQEIDGEKGHVIALWQPRGDGLVHLLGGDYTLYTYRHGDHIARRRGKVKGLDTSEDIVQCCPGAGALWIASGKTLFQVDTATRALVRAIPVNPPGESGNDIRCLFLDNDTTLYVGTRFNLYVTDPSRADRLHPCEFLADPHDDLYVTALCRVADTLYVGTLNRGLFAVHDRRIVDTLLTPQAPYGNIRGLIADGSSIHVHTSRHLYRHVSKDSMTLLANIRLNVAKEVRAFVADPLSGTVVVVGTRGFALVGSIARDSCRGLVHRDITLDHATTAFLAGPTLLLGSRSGLYHYDGALSPVPVEAQMVFSGELFLLVVFPSACVGLVLAILLLYRRLQRRRLEECRRELSIKKEIIEKLVANPGARDKWRADADALDVRIERLERGRVVTHQAVNTIADALFNLKRELHTSTLSSAEQAWQQKRTQVAEKLGLDSIDLCLIDILATQDHADEPYYAKRPKMVEKRQQKIACILDCKNRKHYIVSAAYHKGLLSASHPHAKGNKK